jgi:anti-sigma B factor antagonist
LIGSSIPEPNDRVWSRARLSRGASQRILEGVATLKFTLKVVGDVCVLKLDGKFMAGGDSFFLREKIKNVLSMGIEKLLIDMDNVPYIDSTGVGFLVSSHTSLKSQGGQLKLLKVKPKILEVFKVMSLLSVFELFEDEEVAMKSFEEQARPAAAAPVQSALATPVAAPAPPKKKRSTKAAKDPD